MPGIQSHPVFLTPQQLQPNNPLFIFLPGMDGTGKLLRTQTAGLEAAFDVRSLAIPLDDLTSWEVLTDHVVALVQEEVVKSSKRPVYLCGESFGGCLAMKVALHSPQLFDRILLVNPASSFTSRPWLTLGAQIGRWLPKPLFHLSSLSLMPLLGNMERISTSDRQAFYEAVQSVPQETTIWRMFLLSEFEISEAELRQLTQPTLLLASAADRLLPSVEEAYRLARIFPNARVVVLPNSGHACLLEADINLYEIMKAYHFLEEQDSLHHAQTCSISGS
ncbi:alpha/beta fold hydrolase [Leptothermofonsia sp. ETS-13]|uniref:alpha/beta fold hydrolase n=1 Tax=Leptothermofonsia sp. ETS-13 TaxID=3035696 RepID=UPI003BA2273D